VLPWRYDAEMGIDNSLHASAYYGEYNKTFGFGLIAIIDLNRSESYRLTAARQCQL